MTEAERRLLELALVLDGSNENYDMMVRARNRVLAERLEAECPGIIKELRAARQVSVGAKKSYRQLLEKASATMPREALLAAIGEEDP